MSWQRRHNKSKSISQISVTDIRHIYFSFKNTGTTFILMKMLKKIFVPILTGNTLKFPEWKAIYFSQ